MNDHFRLAGPDVERIRHVDASRAIQCDGYHGYTGLNGQVERSRLKGQHCPVAAASSFRKNQYGASAADSLGGLIEALERLVRTPALHRNVAGTTQMPAQKGHAKQRPFGQEAELNRQVHKEDWNVHRALMIGAEDHRLVGIDILQTFYPGPNAARPQDEPRPEPRAAVLPLAPGIKQRATQRGRPADRRVQANEVVGEKQGSSVAEIVSKPGAPSSKVAPRFHGFQFRLSCFQRSNHAITR